MTTNLNKRSFLQLILLICMGVAILSCDMPSNHGSFSSGDYDLTTESGLLAAIEDEAYLRSAGLGENNVRAVSSAVDSEIPGDANGDGIVNIVDSLLVAKYYINEPVDIDTVMSDVNADFSVTIVDGLLIAQFYVGILDIFPVEQVDDPVLEAFSFDKAVNGEVLPLDINADISGSTINIHVPYGTDPGHLKAVFSSNSSHVYIEDVLQVSGETENNFSDPVIYTVKTSQLNSIDYTVTVTVDEKQEALTLTDLVYSEVSTDPDLNKCDVYLPEDRYFHTPVIVFMHGGGWREDNKGEFAKLADLYRQEGYACVSMNYRYVKPADQDGPEISHVQIMDDITAVLDYIDANSGDWKISGNYALAGYSAGAVNAVLYAHAFDGENRIRTCIAFNGAYDMTDKDASNAMLPYFKVDILALFAGTQGLSPSQDASPVNNINTEMPTLIFHDENDAYMNLEKHVRPYIDALAAKDVPHAFHVVPGCRHPQHYFNPGDAYYDVSLTPEGDTFKDVMDDWLTDYLLSLE